MSDLHPYSHVSKKKDAFWRHPRHFIIRLRFRAISERRQWFSATSKIHRKTRVKLCPASGRQRSPRTRFASDAGHPDTSVRFAGPSPAGLSYERCSAPTCGSHCNGFRSDSDPDLDRSGNLSVSPDTAMPCSSSVFPLG